MPLYHAPKSFVQRLHDYDPLLRVRWSDFKGCWLIERKVRRTRLTYGDSPDPEVRRRTAEGYLHVFSVPHNQLDGRVFLLLAEGDMWKQGGAAGVNRRLDEELERTEYLGELNQRNDLRYVASEMYDSIKRKNRARLNMDVNPLATERINRGV